MYYFPVAPLCVCQVGVMTRVCYRTFVKNQQKLLSPECNFFCVNVAFNMYSASYECFACYVSNALAERKANTRQTYLFKRFVSVLYEPTSNMQLPIAERTHRIDS